jgi:hypothetical protein
MSRIKLALCAGTLALGLAFVAPAVSQAVVPPTVYQPAVVPVETTCQPVAYRSCYPRYWHRQHWHRYHGHYHHRHR